MKIDLEATPRSVGRMGQFSSRPWGLWHFVPATGGTRFMCGRRITKPTYGAPLDFHRESCCSTCVRIAEKEK